VVVFIATTEKSGVDKYSQELAKRLDVKKIEVRPLNLKLPRHYFSPPLDIFSHLSTVA